MVVVLYLLSLVERERGDLEQAVALSEESLVLARDLRGAGIIGWALLARGLVASAQDDVGQARAALAESAVLFWTARQKWYLARALAGLAPVAYGQGQEQEAVRLAGAATALLARMDASLPRSERGSVQAMVDAARPTLGEDAFTAVWKAGQALPLEHVITHARQDIDPAELVTKVP